MLFWAILGFFVTVALAQSNNVCKTFADYLFREGNPNCWYNPDLDAPPSNIVTQQGFPFEAYPIVTEDGYVLGLFRIPHNNTNVGAKRQPLYLFHGIGTSSNIWFDHGPRSLAFTLANQGYDVWMANIRGCRYSRTHLKYTTRDKQFWNFSWETAAYYDVPASLKFIKETTGRKAIYIGYSMGTTISYVYASVKGEHAQKFLKGIISLAPVAYIATPVSSAAYLLPFRDILEVLFAYGLFKYPNLHEIFSDLACDRYPGILVCYAIALSFGGFPDPGLLPEDLPVIFSGIPDGLSIYTYTHYLQVLAKNGRFQRYDYGPKKNLQVYHSKQPPQFNVSDINLCVHLFYGRGDFVATPKDVKVLNRKLKCSSIQEIESTKGDPYTHFDFVYGSNVEKSLYPSLFRRLKQLE